MPARPGQPVKSVTIALICAAVIAVLFVGSIVVSVAVVKAEHAAPASAADTE